MLVAELGHGMLGFPLWWGAVLVRVTGVGLGAGAAQRALPAVTQLWRGAARARAAFVAYGALLVLWGWRLFMPRTDMHAIAAQLAPENLVPLASLAQRVDAFSALHVLQQFLLYLPLGSLLEGRVGFVGRRLSGYAFDRPRADLVPVLAHLLVEGVGGAITLRFTSPHAAMVVIRASFRPFIVCLRFDLRIP